MREILFRGKRIDNGEWVYGYLYITRKGEYEIGAYDSLVNVERITHVVIPETVGEYTGLTDKNKKKIFEGDIVDVAYDVGYVGVAAERIGLFSVIYSEGCFVKRKIDGHGDYHFIPSDVCTVVGNIFDNSEMVGESND